MLWLIMPHLLPHTILPLPHTMHLPHTMPLHLPIMNPNMKITLQHMNTPMLSLMTMLMLILEQMKNEMVMPLVANIMLLFRIVVSKL